MKKLLTGLFFISLFITSCKKQDPAPAPAPPPTFNNVDYGFTIIFDGVTYKIKGNTAYGTLYGNFGSAVPTNMAYSSQYIGANNTVQLQLKSLLEPTYVSGNLINMNIDFTNIQISSNNIVQIWSPQILPYGFTAAPYSNTNTSIFPSDYRKINNFVITDIGIATTYNSTYGKWDISKAVKGSYSGTIYTRSNGTTNTFNIPKAISIEFEAYR